MATRRKKTPDDGDAGQTARKKRARPQKVRPNAQGTQNPDPSGDGLGGRDGLSGQGKANPASTAAASTTAEPGQAPSVRLPGELYCRADQWWWRVKLPGENRAKARPLRGDGATAASHDRETAANAAFEIWEQALQENAAQQAKRESTEKIERLKAQFLDRVRHFTELVEAANAKIETEAKARAEAEAKLAQMTQAAGSKTKSGDQTTAEEGQPGPQSGSQVHAIEDALPPARTEGSGEVIRSADSEPRAQPPLVNAAPPSLIPTPRPETGTCECCGATGIAVACLQRIDSGQSLCPRCLAALRADAAGIDPDVPE